MPTRSSIRSTKSAYRFEHSRRRPFRRQRPCIPGALLPKHKHPIQREIWWVEDGEVEIFFEGKWQSATASSGTFDVPRDGPRAPQPRHRGADLGCEVMPAMDLEVFLTESSWAAREGLIKRGGIPGSIAGVCWAARFLGRHSEQTVMSFPPPFAIEGDGDLPRRRRRRVPRPR